jgi:hypothetical protein
MAPYDLTNEEEEKLSRELEFFLRSTGQLFPITPAQVAAFEEYRASHPERIKVPEIDISAEEILQRGYMKYEPKPTSNPEETLYNEGMNLAARNKGVLSEDILNMMRADQEKGKKK